MASWLDEEQLDVYGEDSEDLFGEDEEDDEALDDEATRKRRRLTPHQRRLLIARQQQQLRRRRARARAAGTGGGPRPPAAKAKAALRGTVAKVEEMDVDNKLRSSEMQAATAANSKRISSTDTALGVNAMANTMASQLARSFPNNLGVTSLVPMVAAVAPLAFVKPPASSKGGARGLVGRPVVWAGAFAAGVAIVGEVHRRKQAPKEVRITSALQIMEVTQSFTFQAEVRGASGQVLPAQVTWKDSGKGCVVIDPTTGRATAQKAGFEKITASFAVASGTPPPDDSVMVQATT